MVSNPILNTGARAGERDERHVPRGWGDNATPLHLWHLTSLDAPTVAVVWSCAFAWAAGLRTQWWTPPLLAMVAWAVYISDRLLDARAGLRMPPQHDLRERHYFHWRHRAVLGACAIGAAGVSAWMMATLAPAAARAPDSAVGVATLAYFSGVHWRRRLPASLQRMVALVFSKEFTVGVLFTAGCLVPAWSQMHEGPEMARTAGDLAVLGIFFAVLAWFNCYAIAHWESARGHSRERRVRRLGWVLCLAATGAAILLVPAEPRVSALLATGAMSAFLLGELDRRRDRLSALTVRAAADLVLLTPVLLIACRFLGR